MDKHNIVSMNKLKDRLKELREERQLSQSKLAKIIGFSQATIAKWETGDRSPTIEYLIILAKFFGCTSDYLIGLQDSY